MKLVHIFLYLLIVVKLYNLQSFENHFLYVLRLNAVFEATFRQEGTNFH